MQTTKVYVANEDTMELQLMIQPIVDVTTGDLYLAVDGLEALATAINTTQTDGSQKTQVVTSGGANVDFATSANQTNGSQKTVIQTQSADVGVQNPFSVDGDSVYAKDIDVANSSIGNFSGAVTDLFNSLSTTVVNSTASNPKEITIKLVRPVDTSVISMATPSGDFSNVKILLKDGAGNVVATIDDSANSTKYQANEYATEPIGWCAATIQFHTADTVTLGFVCIHKATHVHALNQALKPDGTTTFIGATAGGNLKVAVEEIEAGTPLDTIIANQTNGTQVVKGNTTVAEGGDPTTAIHTQNANMAWRSASWRRMASILNNTDATAVATTAENLRAAAFLYYYDGTSAFPRARGDITNGLDVDVTRTPADVSYHGQSSFSVAYGSKESRHVHLDAENVAATTGFMLIDLSDTTNWQHVNTGSIFLDTACLSINPSAAFSGDIYFGFLTNVDATNGDLNIIHTIHLTQGGINQNPCLDWKGLSFDLSVDDWFGPTVANDTTFQTDVNLQGPNGSTAYPSGNGDFVMKIVVTAGNIDVGVTIAYDTIA